MTTPRRIIITALIILTVIAFQLANVNAANSRDRSQVNRCAQRVALMINQLDKLRPQLVKAGRTLGSAIVDPLIALLDDAARTLDKASSRQIACGDLKPAVDALNQFDSKVTSSQDGINSLLGNGTAQSWISQSNKIIKQILLICPCK